MLSVEDNEAITRVGPGTVMGDLLRQYWVPALLSEELPGPDCPPVRIRLLGENLIAFRATSGKVALVPKGVDFWEHLAPKREAFQAVDAPSTVVKETETGLEAIPASVLPECVARTEVATAPA
jgi:hypothetical protein